MNISTKLLKAAAGQAGGASLDVDDVFSTFLYDGTGSAQTITNGIDLSGEGGLVWIKVRSDTVNNALFDSARGVTCMLRSDATNAQYCDSVQVSSFNSNGFTVGSDLTTNASGEEMVSWTFRKAAKFFDVVTYTGNGVAGRTVSHNLDAEVGMLVIKNLSNSQDWSVWHRGANGGTNANQWFGWLNLNNAFDDGASPFNDTAPTSTNFTLGTSSEVNGNGENYVAYLFAHHANDGSATGFGPDGDSPVISCGSYTGDGTTNGTKEITLGFEPQWILTKKATSADNWHINDVMRGQTTDGITERIIANSSSAESASYGTAPTATGFKLYSDNTNGETFIYMAIRRGSLFPPDDATKVFNVNANTVSGVEPVSGFVTDFAIANYASQASPWYLTTRLQGNQFLSSNVTDAEATINHTAWDRMDGAYNANMTNYQIWHWKRAPSYFDVVAYTGTGSARDLSHNLGVVPEMYWIKARDESRNWIVYVNIGGTYKELLLNTSSAASTASSIGGDPTASVIKLGTTYNENRSGYDYIAYLFASSNVSKVGSYTGNGSSSGPTVDCGFSGSPRFVLIKKATGGTGSWYVFDSVRGIVAGAESQLYLNSTAAEQTATDQIDPTSSGFQIVINSGGLNTNGETYIFYAIA